MSSRPQHNRPGVISLSPLLLLVLNLGAIPTLTACSLKNQSTSSDTIQISLPPQQHPDAAPVSLAGFTCLLVNVTGGPIPFDSRLSCSLATDGLGVFAGFFPIGTPSITLSVPDGQNLNFDLIGMANPGGGCPNLGPTLNIDSLNLLGSLYSLATTTVTVSGDMTVDMTEGYTAGVSPTVLGSCVQPALSFSTPPAPVLGSGYPLPAQPAMQILNTTDTSLLNTTITLNAYQDPACTVAASGTLTSNTVSAFSGSANFFGATYTGPTGTIFLGASAPSLAPVCSTAITVMSPAPLLAAATNPISLTLDSTNIYWASATTINSVPLSGGTSTLLANDSFNVFSIASNASNVFWIDGAYLNEVPIGGGTTTQSNPYGYPTAMVVEGANVYFADSPNGVYQLPIASFTTPTLLAPDNNGGFAASYAIAADATNVYWADYDGNLSQVTIAGGTVTPLLTGIHATSLAVDASNVYWGDSAGIHYVPIGGGPITTLATGISPKSIILDATNVYWAGTGEIGSVPIAGGPIQALAAGPPPSCGQSGNVSSNCIAVNATTVYWTAASGIYSVPK